MIDLAGSHNPELAVVAIGAAHDAHPLDLFDGEGFDLLFVVPNEPEGADGASVREGDVLAVRFQFPARLLVLDGAVVMLEAGIALLAGLVVEARFVEALDGEPGARGGGLPCLRVELASEGELPGKKCAQALEVVLGGAAHLHPEAQGLVPDELDDADGLLDGGVLLGRPVYFILVDQHCSHASLSVFIASPVFFLSAPIVEMHPQPSPRTRSGGSSPPTMTGALPRQLLLAEPSTAWWASSIRIVAIRVSLASMRACSLAESSDLNLAT